MSCTTLRFAIENWMIYRGPGFLIAVWFGSSPPCPVDRRDDTQADWERETTCWRDRREGKRAESSDGEKAWSPKNHSILSGVRDDAQKWSWQKWDRREKERAWEDSIGKLWLKGENRTGKTRGGLLPQRENNQSKKFVGGGKGIVWQNLSDVLWVTATAIEIINVWN